MLPSVLQPNATDHVPGPRRRSAAAARRAAGETVIDATFGAGGHAALLAPDLKGEGKFIAVDRDPSVRPYFESFRRRAGVSTRFLRGDFADVFERLADNGLRADAILFDLGVSSMQLDRPERGFSYASDAPLDMRMDPSAEHSARDLVNGASERELTDIFRGYGEERYAKQIARAIVRRRKEQPFERTATSSRRSRARFRRRLGSATVTPPAASSRRFASPSTTSSRRSRPRCRRRSTRSGPEDAWR